MESNNPVRRLRSFLKLSQTEFGRLIGRSHPTVALYEKGLPMPDEVIERVKTIAAEHALADIAIELSSDDWKVRTVIHPPQEFAHRQAAATGAYAPIVDADRQSRHALLDAILDSGNQDAIQGIEHLLRYFTTHLASPTAAPEMKRHHGKP